MQKKENPLVQKISDHALLLWRIRLTAITAICPFLITLFLRDESPFKKNLTVLWILLFLFFFLFYYPIKFRRLSYRLEKQCIVIHCGVFYRRLKMMEFHNIQHLTVSATPLQHLMGLRTLYIAGAGGRIYLPCLDKESVNHLCMELLPQGPAMQEKKGGRNP